MTAVDGSTPPALAGGRPAGSYELTGFENVNLFSGSLGIHLPLLSLKGRGETSVSSVLNIQTRWIMVQGVPSSITSTTPTWYPATLPMISSPLDASPNYGPGALEAREIGQSPVSCTSGNPAMFESTLTRMTFIEPDGTEHDFVDELSGGSFFNTNPVSSDPTNPNARQCLSVSGQDRGRVWTTRDSTFSTLILDSDTHDSTNDAGTSPTPMAVASGYMYLKNGTVYRFDNGYVSWIRDRNGNKVTYAYGTDTSNVAAYGRVVSVLDSLGRTITYSYANSGVNGDVYDEIQYPVSATTNRAVRVHFCGLDGSTVGGASGSCPHYSPVATQTYFSLFGYGSSSTDFSTTVVSYVELPDSRYYGFSYNAYGEVTAIQLPTGGTIQYAYGPGDSSGSNVVGSASVGGNLNIYRRVTRRTTYPSGSTREGSTVFSPFYTENGQSFSTAVGCSLSGTSLTWCTMVGVTHYGATDGTVLAGERHYFYGGANDPTSYYTDGNAYSKSSEGREFRTERLSVGGSFAVGTALALNTETQSWQDRTCDSGEQCPANSAAYVRGSPVDTRELERDTTNDAGQVTSVVLGYDRYNNVTTHDEVGFDGAVRRTETQYLTTNTVGGTTWNYALIPTDSTGQYGTFSGNYSQVVHIRNLPTQVSTRTSASLSQLESQGDSATVEAARSNYTYDNYSSGGFAAALTGSFSQWDSTVPPARGNVTGSSQTLLPGSATLNGYRQYDNAGNVVAIADARSAAASTPYWTKVEYSQAYQGGFATKVTNALGQPVSTGYNYYTGQPTSFQALNGQTTNYLYADPLDRLTEADMPDGGVTSYAYCDAGSNAACPSGAPVNSVTRTVKQNSCGATGQNAVTDSVYDGLGRTYKAHIYEGGTVIVSETTFDGMGRVSRQSNPSRSDPPTDFTTTQYDWMGRVSGVLYPDNSLATNAWAGSTVKATDPNSVTVTDRTYDAFGRLTQVTEENTANFTTYYAYDALDDLTGVCQGASFDSSGNCPSGGLGRSFVYDAVKRLKSARNPESGTVTYGYDENGNLMSKTDNRGWVTSFGAYDPVNRPLSKSYSYTGAGPQDGVAANSVVWVWDTVQTGRLTSVTSGTSAARFGSYDSMGRVTASTQTTAGTSYPFAYTYNAAGGLETETYPSNRVVKTCYDLAGRVSSLSGVPPSGLGAVAYTGGTPVQYAPHGAIQQMTRGDALTETWSYNNRLQPVSINVGSAFGASLYYCPGKALTCATNNGNLMTVSLSVPSADQNFSYDRLNRVVSVAEGSAWKEGFGYDPLGNRWVDPGNTFGVPVSAVTPTAQSNFNASNQLVVSGFAYDGSGDLKPSGTAYSFQWDAEGRLVTASLSGAATSYTYDGEGRRVGKQNTAGAVTYVYDALGELAAEYGGAAITGCTTCYVTADQLGSTRVVTDGSGTTPSGAVVERHDYLPFGEELFAGTGGRTGAMGYPGNGLSDQVTALFTGKLRDPEMVGSAMGNGLDYFGARYYGSAQGRWTSPDWSAAPQAVPYADLHDPQTLNLYSYVRNNPLARKDADGHDDVAVAACTGNEKCLQATADNRAAAVDKAVEFATSPVGIGLLELTAAYFSGGATLGATTLGGVATGSLTTAGFLVRGTTHLAGAAAGRDPKQVDAAASAIGVATNPVSLSATILTGGNRQLGSVAGSAVSAAKIAMNPEKAAQEPAKTALTLRSAANSLRTLFGIFSTPPAPPPPAAPKVPECGGTSCR